jgi:hypothetical protein
MKLLEQRIVAFLDILGFKDAVNSIDETKYREIFEVLSNFSLSNSDHHVNIKQEDDSSLIIRGEPAVSSFSDHVVISIRNIPNYSGQELPLWTFIHYIQNAAATLCDVALQKGFLVRGGVSYGDIIHREKIIYGKALLEAIDIESTVASYPRIVFSHSLTEAIGSQNLFNLYENKSLYKDKDGLLVLNWMSAVTLKQVSAGSEVINDMNQYKEKLLRYGRVISEKLEENKNDIKKLKNWNWMGNYYKWCLEREGTDFAADIYFTALDRST